MSTESERRKNGHTAVNRLALAIVDILTGVVEVSVIPSYKGTSAPTYTLKVKKAGIQDD